MKTHTRVRGLPVNASTLGVALCLCVIMSATLSGKVSAKVPAKVPAKVSEKESARVSALTSGKVSGDDALFGQCVEQQSAELAARACERALVGNPDNTGLLEALGRLRSESGQDAVAVRYFERALNLRAIAGQHIDARRLDELARSYLALHRYRDAAQLYTRYPDVGGELAELATLHGLLAQGRIDAAMSMLGSARLPAASAPLFRARALLLAGQPERSLDALQTAEAMRGQVATRIRMQMLAALAAGDVLQARSYVQPLEAIVGATVSEPVIYALLYIAEGNSEAALGALKRAGAPLGDIAQQPDIASALPAAGEVPALAIAYFRYQLGFFQLAGNGLSAGSGSGVESPLANLLLADSARLGGDLQASRRGYQALTEQFPGAVSLQALLATVLSGLGRPADAEALLADVLELRPDFISAQLARVSLLLEFGRTGEAIQAILWSLNFKPASMALHEALVRALISAGDPGAAGKALRRLELLPGDGSASLTSLASLTYLQGQLALLEDAPERARERFEQSLQQHFEAPDVMRALAGIYQASGQRQSALGLRALASLLDADLPEAE